METGKLTKEVVAQEARFVLESALKAGAQLAFEALRKECEPSISLRLLDYINFLERFGYIEFDRAGQLLAVSADGQRVANGEKSAELVIDVVHHFRPILARTRSADQPALAGATTRRRLQRRATGEARLDGGHYEKIKVLGSGGIGTVYLAQQQSLGRQVALKEIRELFGFFSDTQREEIVRRFDEEVKRSAQLLHPNVVTILDGQTTAEYPYVVSDYVPQGSLRQLLTRAEDLPPDLAVKIFLQMMHGVGHAHARGVVHRGLKPENVLFDDKGNVRLTDFGTARIVERDQSVIQHVYVGMGSVAYLAPELFTQPGKADTRSDLYAAGIILYEMLARRLPGRRSPMPTQLHKGLPSIVDDIFDKLTHDEPDDRYASVEAALEEFYASDDSKAFLEPRGVLLFVENPLEELKLKPITADASSAAAPAPLPSSGESNSADEEMPPRAESGAGAPPDADASQQDPVAGPIGPDDEHPVSGESDAAAEKRRRRGKAPRPYSFQQRIKDK